MPLPLSFLLRISPLTIVAILPISQETLIYGSADGGVSVHNSDAVFSSYVDKVLHSLPSLFSFSPSSPSISFSSHDQIFKHINLQPHLVGNSSITQKVVAGPGDIEGSSLTLFPSISHPFLPSPIRSFSFDPFEPSFLDTRHSLNPSGHRGKDGRYYLLDFARVLPPEFPMSGTRDIYFKVLLFSSSSTLHPPLPLLSSFALRDEMLRAEFVEAYSSPLNPDAFSGWGRPDPDFTQHNKEIEKATNYLYEVVIPATAAEISKGDFPSSYLETCSGSARFISSTSSFFLSFLSFLSFLVFFILLWTNENENNRQDLPQTVSSFVKFTNVESMFVIWAF